MTLTMQRIARGDISQNSPGTSSLNPLSERAPSVCGWVIHIRQRLALRRALPTDRTSFVVWKKGSYRMQSATFALDEKMLVLYPLQHRTAGERPLHGHADGLTTGPPSASLRQAFRLRALWAQALGRRLLVYTSALGHSFIRKAVELLSLGSETCG